MRRANHPRRRCDVRSSNLRKALLAVRNRWKRQRTCGAGTSGTLPVHPLDVGQATQRALATVAKLVAVRVGRAVYRRGGQAAMVPLRRMHARRFGLHRTRWSVIATQGAHGSSSFRSSGYGNGYKSVVQLLFETLPLLWDLEGKIGKLTGWRRADW